MIAILGVYIRGYLGLFANYFSLKSLSLSLKSHMNVLCALKLTELWNSSLFFDLNYKYIMGASPLALAKSIYCRDFDLMTSDVYFFGRLHTSVYIVYPSPLNVVREGH